MGVAHEPIMAIVESKWFASSAVDLLAVIELIRPRGVSLAVGASSARSAL